MKITKRQLRRIIRESVESASPSPATSGRVSVFEFPSNIEMSDARRALNQARIPYDTDILRVEIGRRDIDMAENALFDARVRFRRT
jgi:hypothetical protein